MSTSSTWPSGISSSLRALGLLAGISALAATAGAEVLLTEKAALERAFGTRPPTRRTLYLTEEQVKAVQARGRSRLPSAVQTVYEGEDEAGKPLRAYLDTHVVRTMPETVMTVVDAEGRVKMALVLQFNEPPDYLPRERWLQTLPRKPLDDELWPGRGVPRVTGATLTVQALTEAVRRALAVDELVVRAPKKP